MRDYARISPRFWTGKTGKQIKEHSSDHVAVALYLLSSPHSNMIGLYYLPILYIAHESGVSEPRVKGVLADLSDPEIGFCDYDREAETVWVYEAARFQLGDNPSDSQKKGAANQYRDAPACKFLEAFAAKYGSAIPLDRRSNLKDTPSIPSGGGIDTLSSKEQEQEQEQEPSTGSSDSKETDVSGVTAHYLEIYPRRAAQCRNKKVIRKIREQLKHYSVEDLCRAIDGNAKSEYHQQHGYDGLYCIMQEPERIDRFLKIESGEMSGAADQPRVTSITGAQAARIALIKSCTGDDNARQGSAEFQQDVFGNGELLPDSEARPGKPRGLLAAPEVVQPSGGAYRHGAGH